MKLWDFFSGLIADILSSLGVVCIVLVIAFVISLVAGWLPWPF
jgi:hypothetical protein